MAGAVENLCEIQVIMTRSNDDRLKHELDEQSMGDNKDVEISSLRRELRTAIAKLQNESIECGESLGKNKRLMEELQQARQLTEIIAMLLEEHR